MMNTEFMYGPVFPNPRPLIGCVIGEYGEIHVPATA
jgi:hypothetical protein